LLVSRAGLGTTPSMVTSLINPASFIILIVVMLKKLLFLAYIGLFFIISSCSSDKSKYENALFEIEQGNKENVRKILMTIPENSSYRQKADSLLKVLE
jgi:hypothetical protein